MPRASIRVLTLLAAVASASGCLVVGVSPLYDGETIGWDPALVGSWRDEDDNVTIDIEADEWRSYRIHYVHPIETGDLTAYITRVGDDQYIDVTPARGKDPGSFLVPIHALLRLRLDGDSLEVTPLSYDWFEDRFRTGSVPAGLSAAVDARSNVLVLSSTEALRNWLRRQLADGPMFGAPAVFTRVKRQS